ncbi:MAG TPA: GxxExxY protein [Vicinamibacterales bacterium]|nr:GxxExxY protein [Vicinamibacterales bacterium]
MHDGLHATLTEQIVGCAIEVHRHLGAGLLESAYEAALCIELLEKGLPFERQRQVPLYYKGRLISEYRPDLVVDSAVVVEVKTVQRLEPVHIAQVLTYLRITGTRVGLVLNFNSVVLRQGIRRVVL